ncbi:MAG TPA: hypothetical protein VFD70_16075 [Anaerolineae bacterium]|nr:hypothetical protein [Anaerolineae bacterium]
MSKKSRIKPHPRPRRRSLTPVLLIGGIALIALAILGLVWMGLGSNRTSGGTPQLQVNTERLDFGKQIFGKTVHASFDVKNTGKGTLTLSVPRSPTVLEGC